MVNDVQLEKDIKNYLTSLKAQNLSQTATFLATVYHNYIGKLAMDPFGNIAIRTDGVWSNDFGSQTKEARGENEVKPPDEWQWSPDTGRWEFTGGKVKILKSAFEKSSNNDKLLEVISELETIDPDEVSAGKCNMAC